MYAREALGRLLRDRRKKLGWRQSDVAATLGKSVPYISGVERGERSIAPVLLDRLCRCLSLPPEEYTRAFLLRRRLPPVVEKHFLRNPAEWPVRRTAA